VGEMIEIEKSGFLAIIILAARKSLGEPVY